MSIRGFKGRDSRSFLSIAYLALFREYQGVSFYLKSTLAPSQEVLGGRILVECREGFRVF